VGIQQGSGAYSGRGFGGNFFNLLRFLRKIPLNLPFHTKIFQNPSLVKFLDTPLSEVYPGWGFGC